MIIFTFFCLIITDLNEFLITFPLCEKIVISECYLKHRHCYKFIKFFVCVVLYGVQHHRQGSNQLGT